MARALFGVVMATVAITYSALAQTAENVIIPLYSDANANQDLTSLGSFAPTPAGIVVLDFNVGCGGSNQDPNYQSNLSLITTAHNNHLKVYGYIYSNGGCAADSNADPNTGTNRDCPITYFAPPDKGQCPASGPAGSQPYYSYGTAQMHINIDNWYNWYNPDGIFFDVGSKFPGVNNSVYNFYQELYTYVKREPQNLGAWVKGTDVLLNAAGYQQYNGIPGSPSATVFDLADIVIASEESSCSLASQPSWFSSISAGKVMMVTTNCTQSQLASTLATMGDSAHHAGYVYVYDGSSAAYNRLPTFWNGSSPREWALVKGTYDGFASLSASPSSVQITPSGSANFTVNWSAKNDFSDSINLTWQSSPAGIGVSCSPTTLGAGQSSTCSCSGQGAGVGDYTITLTPGLNGVWNRYPQAPVAVTCTIQAPVLGTFTRTYGNQQGSTGAYVIMQNSGSGTITNIGGQCTDYGSHITSGLASSLAPGASMTVQATLGSTYHCGFQFWGTNASNSPYTDPTF